MPQFKSINSSALSFFTVQLSQPYMTTGKTIALTRQTFVGKIISLLFNTLSRLVITFLPRSKRLLISWLQSPSAMILEPKKIKSDTVYTVSCIYLVTYRQGKAYKLYSKYYSQISSLQGDLTLAFVDLSPPSFYFLLSNSYIEI